MRLGFSVRVLGRPDLPSHGPRVGDASARLSVGLAYLRDILLYLRAQGIHMYRMHCDLAAPPEGSAADWRASLATWRHELAAVGRLAAEYDVRLSFHPYSAVVLDSPSEERVQQSVLRLEAQAAFLEALELGPEAVIVLHVGGVYESHAASQERFGRRYEALPAAVRQRVVLENDDHRFSYAQVRQIHAACGVPLVLDTLHHQVHNPEGVPLADALAEALSTWPPGVTPKVHFASPRTELRPMDGPTWLKLPSWTEHSDFANPFEWIAFARMAAGLRPFDVMLECKARDVALCKLREDVQRFAPELAPSLS